MDIESQNGAISRYGGIDEVQSSGSNLEDEVLGEGREESDSEMSRMRSITGGKDSRKSILEEQCGISSADEGESGKPMPKRLKSARLEMKGIVEQ